ncbi:MAG TPA: lipid-A-disaccharide synthase [Victivallales bacterium]|nr:lipid-A-disaccharide synthase [Victivallales bacterium]
MNKENKNIWIMAGETSGDRYGARLYEELIKLNPGLTVSGMGGKAMKEAGVTINVDSTELGVVGLIEVLKHIGTFIKIFKSLVKKAEEEKPDAVILIDNPGFNLRFAKQMHKRGIRVIWYVSPQVWAWGKKRIPKLAEYCTKMLVIFPFEVEVYGETSLDVEFVGHPLVDFIRKKMQPNITLDPNDILLLPGSRFSEINRNLKVMLGTVSILKEKHPNLNFKLSAARPKIEKQIKEIIDEYKAENSHCPEIEIFPQEKNTEYMQKCGTGIATSGTITVECAIVGIPIVSFNILHPFTFFLAAHFLVKKLFRGFFVMPNIISNKLIYEEFLQNQSPLEGKMADAMERILPQNGERRQEVLKEINDIAENKLTYGKENASKNAALAVLRTLDN